MPENAPRGPELLTMMLKIAMVVVVVFFLIYMFAIFRAKTEGRFLERNAYQLGEDIYFQQPEKFVFEKDLLDSLKDKEDEFFARSCDASYAAAEKTGRLRDCDRRRTYGAGIRRSGSTLTRHAYQLEWFGAQGGRHRLFWKHDYNGG